MLNVLHPMDSTLWKAKGVSYADLAYLGANVAKTKLVTGMPRASDNWYYVRSNNNINYTPKIFESGNKPGSQHKALESNLRKLR